ncbi:hypothetical protein IK112_01725 [Candidatus Saccharibacteria bacterium]|nr:hypothetical protein [Candidatus Saccharibacteria bacterium]
MLDSSFFQPVVMSFRLNKDECCGIIEVSGDISHYNRVDNPIIEIFRAVEQDVRKENGHKLSFSAGCPIYNPAKNITACRFYPNMANLHWRPERIRVKMEEILEGQISPRFTSLLTDYFVSDEFKDYQLNLSALLAGVGDNKDIIDTLTLNCKKSIKDFIKKAGYDLPKNRKVQIMPKGEELNAKKAERILEFLSNN